jgi:hypothetical protein
MVVVVAMRGGAHSAKRAHQGCRRRWHGRKKKKKKKEKKKKSNAIASTWHYTTQTHDAALARMHDRVRVLP